MKIWIADWFAQLNYKMDGDINKIQTVGHYFIEVWKAAGMNLDGGNVEFLWSSEEIMSRSRMNTGLLFENTIEFIGDVE